METKKVIFECKSADEAIIMMVGDISIIPAEKHDIIHSYAGAVLLMSMIDAMIESGENVPLMDVTVAKLGLMLNESVYNKQCTDEEKRLVSSNVQTCLRSPELTEWIAKQGK